MAGHDACEMLVAAEMTLAGFPAEGHRNPKHRQQWENSLRVYGKPLWTMKIDEVDTDAVLKCIAPVWLTKAETAARVRGRIEKVLAAAIAKKLHPGPNPALWKGHLDALLPQRKKLQRGHHEALAYTELPAFWQKLSELDSVSSRALAFTILTAARSGETMGATWKEFDLDAAVWIVPAVRMKSGREHRVPLSPAAIVILKEMAILRLTGEPYEYVFPGAKSGKPLSVMAMAMCLRGINSTVTVHGFRSSFRDWAGEETLYAREVAEAALAHAVGDETERAYRRGDALEKRRALMKDWANFATNACRENIVRFSKVI